MLVLVLVLVIDLRGVTPRNARSHRDSSLTPRLDHKLGPNRDRRDRRLRRFPKRNPRMILQRREQPQEAVP